MSPLVGPNGQPVAAEINIRRWSRGSKPKCSGVSMCEMLRHSLEKGDVIQGTKLAAIGDERTTEGVGYLVGSENTLYIFDHCPFCGSKLQMKANRRSN